ncbi:Stage II sporulation protein R [uncultured Eubacteriales bacterium]|uniref:Stage II sporulation protein R n=1 Tax=uncultured Eubacteriales bacterium TaxID=172733 RepID=A0A212K619_9FIRM|nr:Stage II sporulation protein R [uncultured Eubacteriales bacterium]
MLTTKSKLRRWEIALLLGVGVAALLGGWLNGQQRDLADKVIRLHVIANSDSQEDQALKLQVRDRILAEAGDLFTQGLSREAAEAAIAARLGDFAAVGAETVGENGYDYPVTAAVEQNAWFPTKEYDDFALPAGEYTALRVVIGDGGGQNWWCVVFPPLCLGSVTETTAETAAEGGLTSGDIALITGENEGYIVKFKAMELWDEFQQWMKS